MEETKIQNSKNKDYVREYNKKYYHDNKERIIKMISERINCPWCGKNMAKSNIYKHQKRIKCMKKRIEQDKVRELEEKIKELEIKLNNN